MASKQGNGYNSLPETYRSLPQWNQPNFQPGSSYTQGDHKALKENPINVLIPNQINNLARNTHLSKQRLK
jgi:hypothetical protein